MVYFIRSGDDGPIKIGHARDVQKRVKMLQTGSHVVLRILGAVRGGRLLERQLHHHFASHRLSGEWFAPHADVLCEIEQMIRVEFGMAVELPPRNAVAVMSLVRHALLTDPRFKGMFVWDDFLQRAESLGGECGFIAEEECMAVIVQDWFAHNEKIYLNFNKLKNLIVQIAKQNRVNNDIYVAAPKTEYLRALVAQKGSGL